MDPLGLAAQCGGPTKQQNNKVPSGLALGSVIVGKGNQNDFRKMSDNELLKYEINAHEEKSNLVGKRNVSKYDIYRSKSTGDLYVAQKGIPRGSELQPVNMRISGGSLYNVAPGELIPDLPVDELPIDFPDLPL